MNDYQVNYKIDGMKKTQIIKAKDEGEVIKKMQKIDRNVRITNIQRGRWVKDKKTGKNKFELVSKTYMKVPEASVIICPPANQVYNIYQNRNNIALIISVILFFIVVVKYNKHIKKYKKK